jgi:hypothetical protein
MNLEEIPYVLSKMVSGTTRSIPRDKQLLEGVVLSLPCIYPIHPPASRITDPRHKRGPASPKIMMAHCSSPKRP